MKKFLLTLIYSSNLFSSTYGIKAEFLYWAPLVSENEFYSTPGVKPHVHLHTPTYHSAFRLDALFGNEPCGTFLEARFTYLNAKDRLSRFDTGNLFGVRSDTITGDFASTYDFKYYVGELTNAWEIASCNLYFLGGVHYAWFGYNSDDSAKSPTTSARAFLRSQFWGVGPQIGVDFLYTLPCCTSFAIAGNARTSLLVSRLSFRSLTQTTKTSNDPQWQIVPAADMRLGLNWEPSWRCLNLILEAGYEFVWIHNCYFINIPDSLGFHGPYASIGMCY